MLAVATLPVSTLTFSMRAFLKPGASASTLYRTGSSASAVKLPASDVLRWICWLVPRLMMTTVALATAAPVGSETVPLMPPRLVCAYRADTQDMRTTRLAFTAHLYLWCANSSRSRLESQLFIRLTSEFRTAKRIIRFETPIIYISMGGQRIDGPISGGLEFCYAKRRLRRST